MKIIDKKRDFYDYLVGIYGIDEKLVLDRRNSTNIQFPPNYLRFYIAGYIIEGLYVDKKFYYGKALDKFKIKDGRNRTYMSKHWNRDYEKSILVKYNEREYVTDENWIYQEPILDKDDINQRFNCPILIATNAPNREVDVKEYPLLKDFDLAKFIPAETIYQWLSAWLGNQITLKEQSPELSNDGKIEAKGFCKKRSFRTKMK
jgi:hypothetical protein